MNFRPRNDRCSRTIRRFAAHLLGDIKDPRGVLILVGLLHDQDVNSIVPCSLGEIGDASSVPVLLQALGADNLTEGDNAGALSALQRLGEGALGACAAETRGAGGTYKEICRQRFVRVRPISRSCFRRRPAIGSRKAIWRSVSPTPSPRWISRNSPRLTRGMGDAINRSIRR